MRRFVVFGFLLALTACAPAGRGTAGAGLGSHPQRLDVAEAGNVNTLNPILATQQFEVQVETLAMDPLISVNGQGRDVPILARIVPTQQNGGISRDGLTLTYHLRHGVRWQDGAPFSSHDVAFTVAAIMNPKTVVATRHGYDDIARVDTPDAYTVVFHLKRPFAPAVETLFGPSDAPVFIIPQHLLAKYPDLNHVPFNSLPVGTGPFKVVRWLHGDRIEFVRNDRYFLGKPHLERITVHYVPDENTIVNELRSHEVDWFVQASPKVYPELAKTPGVDVRLVPFNGYDAIMFETKRAPWSDVRLRRAVNLTIDKGRLVRDVTYGTTLPATEDIPSFMWAFDPHAGTDRRDLPAAEALLDAAGWHPGSDGVRTRNGMRLTLELAYRNDSLTDRNRGVVIASMLREAGIDTELKGYTTALLYGAPEGGGILSGGKYQGGLLTWYAGHDPDDSSQFLCDQVPPGGYNWSRICVPALDAAERTALLHYDRPTRTVAYANVQRILADQVPYVFLWWPRQIEPVDARLQNFEPNGTVEAWNAYEWSFNAADRK